MTRPDTRKVFLTTPHGLIASGFGSGLAPKAPGTFGSLAALPLWWLLAQVHPWTYAAVTVAAFLLGVWACERTGRALGEADHGGMVWDEFVGLWIGLALIPMEPLWVIGGFAAFRFFDILKPFPIRNLERRVAGGLGVMLDDVIAGVYTLLLLLGVQQIVERLI